MTPFGSSDGYWMLEICCDGRATDVSLRFFLWVCGSFHSLDRYCFSCLLAGILLLIYLFICQVQSVFVYDWSIWCFGTLILGSFVLVHFNYQISGLIENGSSHVAQQSFYDFIIVHGIFF
jgi:hypothetical protein